MNLKLNLTVHSPNAKNDATNLAIQLGERNLRRVKVEQLKEAPRDGELSPAEWSNIITLVISSGFALGAVKAIFDLLKGVFVDIPKSKIEANTKIHEIDSNKEIADAEINQKSKYVEFDFECGDKKYSFKVTKNDEEERSAILDAIMELEKNCK
jgi:hypothetical protein